MKKQTRKNMKRNIKNIKKFVLKNGFIVMGTIIAMIIIVMCSMAFGVSAKDNDSLQIKDKAYYRQLENTFSEVIRNSLEKEGYTNCGITINSISKLGEKKEYIVMIHHFLINELEDNERENLIAKLEVITYPYGDCNISYQFIE